MNKLGKCLSKSDCSSAVELAVRESKQIVIKDQVFNATSLQTGNPMCGIAHPSKLEEKKCWGLGLRAEVWK